MVTLRKKVWIASLITTLTYLHATTPKFECYLIEYDSEYFFIEKTFSVRETIKKLYLEDLFYVNTENPANSNSTLELLENKKKTGGRTTLEENIAGYALAFSLQDLEKLSKTQLHTITSDYDFSETQKISQDVFKEDYWLTDDNGYINIHIFIQDSNAQYLTLDQLKEYLKIPTTIEEKRKEKLEKILDPTLVYNVEDDLEDIELAAPTPHQRLENPTPIEPPNSSDDLEGETPDQKTNYAPLVAVSIAIPAYIGFNKFSNVKNDPERKKHKRTKAIQIVA